MVSHSSGLAELIVRAWIPARAADSTWLRISASSGEMITVGPAPRRRSRAVATKYTADLPQPVRCTTKARLLLPHQSHHRLPLVLPQPRRTPRGTDQLSEDGIGFSAELQMVHAPMQPDGTANPRIHPT